MAVSKIMVPRRGEHWQDSSESGPGSCLKTCLCYLSQTL